MPGLPVPTVEDIEWIRLVETVKKRMEQTIDDEQFDKDFQEIKERFQGKTKDETD